MADETPEQKRISELLVKNAKEAMWGVYVQRVQRILDRQKKEFEADPDHQIHTSHVLMPPDFKQVEAVATAIMGGMMFERHEIEFEIGQLLEESLGKTTRNPEARAVLARIIGTIRARGPHARAPGWGPKTGYEGQPHEWGEKIEKEIRDHSEESVKAQTLRQQQERVMKRDLAEYRARYDVDKQDWSVEHVANAGGPSEREAAGEATTELAVAGAENPQPAAEAVGGGKPLAGRQRRRTAKAARRHRGTK